MKSSGRSFSLAVFSLLYFCDSLYAIYDPRETHAVKPPKRYEFGIPWYLSSGTTEPSIDSQISDWNQSSDSTPRNPVIVNDGAVKYRPQYETANGEIEQQSISDFQNNYEQGQYTDENSYSDQTHVVGLANVDTDQNYEQNGWFSDDDDIQKPYEDFAIEIKKPYKDTKGFTTEPVESIKIAKYDSAVGAQCPTSDATGQFVYPPDCKFFVNCWNGRAFVQPCAPGTLFNPETLECDFPMKVKCYGSELEDLTDSHNAPPSTKKQPFSTAGSQREWRVTTSSNDPSCPPWFTGLLPHPYDCKKFLQCANGETFIMDCGPGTVFNPAYSVCDWPYNVKGCGNAPDPEVETTTIPMRDNFDVRGKFEAESEFPVEPDIVKCPNGQEGLLPHPNDCKKFLQCSNGITYVMDCGPGTVFNPANSVCDWPYNVEGCGKAKPTVTDHSQSGINTYEQNSEGQNSYVASDHRGTTFDHTAYPNNSPNPPINSNSNNGQDYKHDYGQNDNHDSHGSSYPNTNWHQYDDNHNYGQSTEDPHHIPNSNGNWNTYHRNDPNYGQSGNDDSGGSYGHTTQPHSEIYNPTELDQNIYVDSNYNLPDENAGSHGYRNHGRDLPATNPIWIPPQPSATTENVINQQSWNQEETKIDQPGKFKPSMWSGDDAGRESPSNTRVQRPWLQEEPPFPVSYMPPVQPIDYIYEPPQISPVSGQILRLRGGSTMGEGYLEVQGAQPGWGIVCDRKNEWSLKEANVVCRQLGYTRGAEMAWQGHNNQGEALTWIAADSVQCVGNETYFQSCTFTYDSRCDVARDAVGIRCLPNRVAYCREDEIPHRGFCYHLASADTALNHAEALSYCNNKESKLLDIIDQNENNFISEWLVQSYPDVSSVMTSGFGFTTLNRTLWLWEDSQHAKFRFAKWWPGWMSDKRIPPSVGIRPACVVMKRNFPCHNRPDDSCTSDYFFWDIEDCAASSRGHSYVCKRAYNDIGCVYGKGQHYSGKADVTALGTKCLSWGDESVEQYLNFKVISTEIREKFKEHNYCRNPNPMREIKPWCFTGSNGQFDYCDIPSCAKEGTKKSVAAGQCKPKHFECTPGECIPSPWICDGEEDCTNGADEQACFQHLEMYTKTAQHRLDGYDVEKWLNTPLKTCALRCKEADFTCRSFSHKADGNVCLLSDSNVGLTGALQPSEEHDYYEMNERSIDCSDMFVCGNQKCINQSLVCNGKNNCGDRTDENICDIQDLGYEIRLSGSDNNEEGRVEVKAWGHWGQVCDDGFGMIAASVACKELGFPYGAREVRSAGFYSKGETASFLMDQIKCRGNETSLRECDFDGWGVHNCLPDEAVGIVCKTAVNTCPDGSWKCDNSPECIPTPFVCDEVVDCGDGSDEGPEHCDAPFELRLSDGATPLEGRVEVRHHGIWGTVCDDDFSKAAATVICRSLGYGGSATAVKNGAFGPGEGPIWLDEVSCYGNETQLYKCDHEPWGRHNCGHDEDAGVRCERGEVILQERSDELAPDLPEIEINDLLPADCGMRVEDFDEDDEYMARVVQGSIAPKGAYPWQASLRVRGHSRSSHWCGAVVISPLHVLTAAHCLEGYNKGMYFVRAGDFHTEVDDGTEVEANIEDYYIHEDFRKGQRMNNDIALVLLKGRGIPLGRNIMPICLPPENVEYLPGLNCTISGWGSIESGKSVQSNFLRFGWVPILDQSLCRADYVYGEGAISDGMVCAGYLNEGVDSCDGDSGGPLACYHNNAFTLYGLTSWGKHCGAPNKPGVYVRIAHYRRWIDQKIQESLSGR